MATRIVDAEGDELKVASDGSIAAAGNVASGATDSGNPVKVGGIYNTSEPILTAGQRGDLQLGSRGSLKVELAIADSPTPVDSTDTQIDGRTTGAVGIHTVAFPHTFNGTTWDRGRGNTDITVLASAARTASVDSADIVNYNARGLHLVIDATAITATPSITVTIQGKDALSGKYYTILAAAAITTVSTTVLKVAPALTASANLVANDILPRTWRVSVVAGDADSITYSVGASLI